MIIDTSTVSSFSDQQFISYTINAFVLDLNIEYRNNYIYKPPKFALSVLFINICRDMSLASSIEIWFASELSEEGGSGS